MTVSVYAMMTDEALEAALNPKPRAKFDNVTSGDELEWGFLEDGELLESLRSLAGYWARAIDDPMVDVDDLYQEALCYISCRPELQEQTQAFIRTRVGFRFKAIANACRRRVALGLAGEPEDAYPEERW